MKPVSPRLHGVVDYTACAAMLLAPGLLKLGPEARRASQLFATAYLFISVLTDYPPSLRRVIPFPLHGHIELASTPALLAVALSRQGRERLYFLGLAGVVLSTYTLTDWQADPNS